MVDADEPGPFAGFCEMGSGRQIPKTLQGIDLLLEAVPKTGPECLNRFHVALLFLAEFRRVGMILLTGGTRRTARAGKIAQGLYDGVRNQLFFGNKDWKDRQPRRQFFQFAKKVLDT